MPFSIQLQKSSFRFNCAHFVAFKGYRERLHGHNYQVQVNLLGTNQEKLCDDGYLMDFGVLKEYCVRLCKSWNEHVIIPMKSDCLTIRDDTMDPNGKHIEIICEDKTRFSFPKDDCLFLPIYHSTVEEMSMFFAYRLIESITLDELKARNIYTIEVSISENPEQAATYKLDLESYTEKFQLNFSFRPKSCLSSK